MKGRLGAISTFIKELKKIKAKNGYTLFFRGHSDENYVAVPSIFRHVDNDKKKDKYIIMSSHGMNQIEEFCSDILILDKGKSVLQGNLKEIKDNYEVKVAEIISSENIEKYLKELNFKDYTNIDNNYTIKIKSKEEGFKIFNLLVKNKIEIIKFELKKPSLHDIFIERVGK